MAHWKKSMNKERIGAHDLYVNGTNPAQFAELTVTINHYTEDKLPKREKKQEFDIRPVLHFREKGIKPMIVNNTIGEAIESIYGADIDFWIGRQITLYVDKNVRVGADIICAIRVRSYAPATPFMQYNGHRADELEKALSACKTMEEFKAIAPAKGTEERNLYAAIVAAQYNALQLRINPNTTVMNPETGMVEQHNVDIETGEVKDSNTTTEPVQTDSPADEQEKQTEQEEQAKDEKGDGNKNKRNSKK